MVASNPGSYLGSGTGDGAIETLYGAFSIGESVLALLADGHDADEKTQNA